MGYESSLKKAWDACLELGENRQNIMFMNEEYEINRFHKSITSASSKEELKDYYKILVLHYLQKEREIIDIEDDGWISFKELEGGSVYFPTFRKRAVEPILNKYSNDPYEILKTIGRLNGERLQLGNVGISIRVFPKVKVAVILWEKDDEFEAECSMLFNSSIKNLFPTEDVAVLGGIVAHRI